MGSSDEETRPPAVDAPEAMEMGSQSSVGSGSGRGDPESSPKAWLCVLGAFLFLYPSYGERTSRMLLLDEMRC